MSEGQTKSGYRFERERLDAVERRFWGDFWDAVPTDVAAEHGIEKRDFGPLQATVTAALPQAGMMNLVLGATQPEAVAEGWLATALEWAAAREVSAVVPVNPGEDAAAAAERVLADAGYRPVRAWMKFVRDAHPPRFAAPSGVEVRLLGDSGEAPFGMIAAAGFGLPAWAAAFFATLPDNPDWRCYVAIVDGEPQACGAMLIRGEIAELGIAATLEPARGRGCQLALLRERIVDAAQLGCETLFIETGARAPDRPASSYRNILRAGFEEAYLRPNWVRQASA